MTYRSHLEGRPVKTRPWLEPFERYLSLEGFRRRTILSYLACLGRVGDHLANQGLDPIQLTEHEDLLERILGQLSLRQQQKTRAALHHWQGYQIDLEPAPEQVVCGQLDPPLTRTVLPSRQLPVDPPGFSTVTDYLNFVREHQGLSDFTVRRTLRHLRELAGFAGHPDSLVDLPLTVLDGFVASKTTRGTVGVAAGVIRGFLRYLFLVGFDSRDRSAWIEAPRHYGNEKLPRHLSEEQLEQAFRQVDRQTAHGKKTWAILALLTNYGLRIGEVAHLLLEDISWEARSLRVRRRKTGVESLYPLTPAVEEALLDYLQVRPDAPFQEVFLTTQCPCRPYSGGASLVSLVQVVLQRVGRARGKGSHAVRHTLGRRMREAGVPLGLMRRVMGHRSSESTGVYLRISLEELREVADNYADLL